MKTVYLKIQARFWHRAFAAWAFAASPPKPEGVVLLSVGGWLQMPCAVNVPCQNPSYISRWIFFSQSPETRGSPLSRWQRSMTISAGFTIKTARKIANANHMNAKHPDHNHRTMGVFNGYNFKHESLSPFAHCHHNFKRSLNDC